MDQTTRLSPSDVAQGRTRRYVAMHLQEIEGNPLDAADIAMFEMFEREGWSFEQRRDFIIRQARSRAAAE